MKHEQLWVMCAAAGAAIVVIVGAAGAALAQQQQGPITIIGERNPEQGLTARVSYRDLNLAAARDEQILNRRVGRATRDVCEPPDAYIGEPALSDCVSFAWNGARPQISLAVQRAREIASTGTSSIPLVAIAVIGR